MTLIAFLRHGPTEWNREKRLQGRHDLPLLEESRAWLAGRRLPPPFAGAKALVSPLRRARETAAALGLEGAEPTASLIEMDFGAFEGRRLSDLRAELGDGLKENEARGLDFRPPGGESPREVQARLARWLAEAARQDGPLLAVTHKGVMRCLLTLAYGWDMTGRQPVRLDWTALQVFRLDGAGRPEPHRINLPLLPR
ncbi:MAG: histidine phosphatase family protein [Alphaproteobacteria bacterium]|nr:histidine phosphatase family protein [Alphaproteobacteria bacterium]